MTAGRTAPAAYASGPYADRPAGSEVVESREPEVISVRTEREVVAGVFYDKDGERHEYAYTAAGFAYERVERMLNPWRDARSRRFS
jgi:hypothetical protein